jgi:DNA-binding transcriptional MerR regulator
MFLPGTVINVENISSENVQNAFSHIFMAGGLVLSQVSALSGMESHTVQNWVKRGFCPPPVSKKYSECQFCRLITINMLKECMTITEITELISYINGRLDDESDDIIADDRLYFVFVEMLYRTEGHTLDFDREIGGILDKCGIAEQNKGRLSMALKIMLYAYRSSQYKKIAADLFNEIKEKTE